MTRIGIGYDAHRLAENRALVLGGVNIPFERGLLGHSDADALTHAVIDALLGAAAMGDIGRMFPDTDMEFKDVSSLVLLSRVKELLYCEGYHIINIDCVIIAQRPRLAPYLYAMEAALADCLGLPGGTVNVKATTEEGMGFTGSSEGIAAKAVCLLGCGGAD